MVTPDVQNVNKQFHHVLYPPCWNTFDSSPMSIAVMTKPNQCIQTAYGLDKFSSYRPAPCCSSTGWPFDQLTLASQVKVLLTEFSLRRGLKLKSSSRAVCNFTGDTQTLWKCSSSRITADTAPIYQSTLLLTMNRILRYLNSFTWGGASLPARREQSTVFQGRTMASCWPLHTANHPSACWGSRSDGSQQNHLQKADPNWTLFKSCSLISQTGPETRGNLGWVQHRLISQSYDHNIWFHTDQYRY